MKRIVILGPGGSGKSVLAREIGAVLGLPVIELDERFWRPGPSPTPPEEWRSLLATLVSGRTWILDGDLGEYDDVGLALRLQAADAVIFLDFPRRIYLWRALRRSREGLEFWKWAWRYRDTSRPRVLAAIASHARRADVHVLLHPRSVGHFVLSLERKDDRDE